MSISKTSAVIAAALAMSAGYGRDTITALPRITGGKGSYTPPANRRRQRFVSGRRRAWKKVFGGIACPPVEATQFNED